MKKAFTLAEILITIGIIGVVAAMTLPSVWGLAQLLYLKQDGLSRKITRLDFNFT